MLFLMAICSVGLIGAVGVAVDVGTLFIAKEETQTYVDAGALAAALKLDGTTNGIAAARQAVMDSSNSWKFNTQTVNSTAVDFATASNGPWVANPSPANGYTFARVKLNVSANLYFLPVIARRYTQNVISKAVAGQIEITSFSMGTSPYTLVSTNTTGPFFGLTQGGSYTIQWPGWNGNSNQCRANNSRQCFVQAPCPNDTNATMWAVSQNWGANTNGYWGFGSNNLIRESVLDGLQLAPIAVGDNIRPLLANGNKAAQALFLDERTRQDGSNLSNVYSAYRDSAGANGRRIMLVPILNPVSTTVTRVLGFGVILSYTNGANSNYYSALNGNAPFCGVYVGPYTLGSGGPGGATNGSGAFRVKLVE